MFINRRSFTSLFALGLSLGFLTVAARAEDQTITIAYQTGFSPFVRAVASGEIEKIPGFKVEFRQFNSGAEIFAAIAAGDVQIGDVGSSPFAASTSKGIDVKAIYISGAAGEDEALVARNGSGIGKLEDLKGKRLAAAPVSTDHFMLLSTLKQLGIKPDEATVLAIPQPEIVADSLEDYLTRHPRYLEGSTSAVAPALLTTGEASEISAALATFWPEHGAFEQLVMRRSA